MKRFNASPRQDEAQIRELQARQAAAWNRHDATAYANLFTEDGDAGISQAHESCSQQSVISCEQ